MCSLFLVAMLEAIIRRELAHEAAQLFRQRHIGLEFRGFLGRKRRHVERIGDATGHQIV